MSGNRVEEISNYGLPLEVEMMQEGVQTFTSEQASLCRAEYKMK
jgi:hypothetical protein